MEPPIFNDQKLFGLALNSFNVGNMICCFEARINQLLTKLNQKPHSVTSFKIKAGYALKLAQRSACSPRKKRHAILRLIKALVMLLHVCK